MKMKTNKPTILLLSGAILLSTLLAVTTAMTTFSVSAETNQDGTNNEPLSEGNSNLPDGHKNENHATPKVIVPDKINPETSDTESGCFSNIETQTASKNQKQLDAGSVTYETTGNYVHTIYANGQPLIIEASSSVSYAKLYLDSNGNGIGEASEEITAFQGDGKLSGSGIYYLEGYGYYLPYSTIYGGGKDGTPQYDTSVTLSGLSDSSENYTVWAIYGGSKSGALTGNTQVNISGGNIRMAYGGSWDGTLTGSSRLNISGGNVGWTYGGCGTAELNGNAEIHMTGGSASKNMYGGSASGQINGNTRIHIESGQVVSVYGGNENSGQIAGSTELIFDTNAKANGWIYGGGAGYSDDAITEVTGSTNITVNGGTFAKNMYGGGAWRGAKVGGSNITVNGGVFDGWIYGGGEELSSVADKVFITIKGGSVSAVSPAGAGFGQTGAGQINAEVGDAEVHLEGGTVQTFSTLSTDYTAVNGDLSLSLSGDTFSDTELYLGRSGNPVKLKNVSIHITDGKARLLKLQSQVTGNFSVALDRGDVSDLVLLPDTLAVSAGATLSYTDCGSSTGRFGTFVQGSSNYFTDIDNPLLVGSHLYHNQFTTITFRNSYVNYYDDTMSGDDNSPKACTEKLLIDGGTLRLTGDMLTNMPATEFQNNPLLLRTSSFREGVHFEETPVGAARLQWMDTDGTGIPENMSEHSIAETPLDTPDETFSAANTEYALKRDNASRSDSTGQIWQGSAWYTDKAELLCKCQVIGSSLVENLFPLPAGNASASFPLQDALTGNTNLSSSCLVIGHRGTSPSFTYSVIPDGTAIADAAITNDTLTVSQTGSVHVNVTQNLNGRSHTYDTYVYVLQVPQEDSFRFTKGLAEDISLSFQGDGITFERNYSYIWNNSDHAYMDTDSYTMTLENDVLTFVLKEEYLNQLELGEYDFQACAYVNQGGGSGKRYEHTFKVNIALPTEVTDPVIELPQERYQYDGTKKMPSVTVKDKETVIPSSEYTVSYQNNLDVGTASVTITDNPGGNYIVNGKATFEIVNDYLPENGVDYGTTPLKEGWANCDFVVTATENHVLSTDNTADGEWVKEITRTGETKSGLVSFYVKDLETGAISLTATEEYKLDRTEPEDYDIHFNESSVKKLIHEVTFGLLFRETVEVKITARDTLSGIGHISYFLSDTILTEEQVRKITDWCEGEHFHITAEDAKKMIVYAKAADRAGNLVCFASDGAEFDLTPPAITGVTDGEIYYTTQAAAITDKHPGTVMLNGQSVSGTILLPGNVEETYVIKAVDQAGNETIATIQMKPIQTIAEPIGGLVKDTVTSDDQMCIRAVITELELLLDSEHLTEQEKAAIDGFKHDAEILDAQVISASKAADAEEIQAVDGISKDTVSLEDRDNLEKAKDALEAAIHEYGENYTDDEKQEIEDNIARIDESLESLRNVQAVTDAILNLPDAAFVSPDDTEAEQAAKEAEELFDALTEHEKSLVDTTILEQVLAALTDYQILEGDNSQWKGDNSNHLVFKANGAVDKFTGILVDEETVDDKNYTVTSGSTVITLKAGFLGTLANGKHRLTVLYLDGETSAVFEILPKSSGSDLDKPTGGDSSGDPSDKPSGGDSSGDPSGEKITRKPSDSIPSTSVRTGDEERPLRWLVCLLSSFACVSGTIFYRRKKKSLTS